MRRTSIRAALIPIAIAVAGCASARNPEPDDRDAIHADGQSMEELFAGRFPGVEVSRAPGGGISIRIRGANTIGMVIERKRRDGEKDGLLWFCENCNNKLYEEYFELEDITTQFQDVFKRFYGSDELRTCNNCGTVMQPPPIIS